MRRITGPLSWLVVLVLVGCTAAPPQTAGRPAAVNAGGGGGVAPGSITADELDEVAPGLLAPLVQLPACQDPPAAPVDASDVDGLLLPDKAIVTARSAAGELTNLQGYVPMTPIQVRVFYQFRQERLRPILLEDEIQESESLVGDGQHRLFVKAKAVCSQGSVFVAIVAPESASGAVPRPSRAGG